MNDNDKMLDQYMSDIKSYSFISPEKEKELSDIIHNKSSAEKEKIKAKDELILGNLRLVVKIAINMYQKIGFLDDVNLSVMDLIQAGNVALMRAADLFLSSKNCKFGTYAHKVVERRMMKAVKESRLVRIPPKHFLYMHEMDKLQENKNLSDEDLAKNLHITKNFVKLIKRNRFSRVSVEDIDVLLDQFDMKETPLADAVSHNQLRSYLFEKMKKLKPNYRDALFYRFFSNKEVTLSQIGQKFGISKQAVRVMLAMAIRELKGKIDDEARSKKSGVREIRKMRLDRFKKTYVHKRRKLYGKYKKEQKERVDASNMSEVQE